MKSIQAITLKGTLLILVGMIALFSCKKKSDPSPADNNTTTNTTAQGCTLTKIYHDSLFNYALTYDANQRVSSVQITYANINGATNINYDANGKVSKIANKLDGLENNVETRQYDAQGRVKQIVLIDTIGNIGRDSIVFSYATPGQINKTIYSTMYMSSPAVIYYDTLTTIVILDTDGDPVKELYRPFLAAHYNNIPLNFNRDTLVTFASFEYVNQPNNLLLNSLFFSTVTISNIQNANNSSTDSLFYMFYVTNTDSKKLVSKRTIYEYPYPYLNGSGQMTDHPALQWATTYQFDSKGMITEASTTESASPGLGGNLIDFISTKLQFSYDCK
jgi:hypothetical protein